MKIDGSVGYRHLDKVQRNQNTEKSSFAETIKKSVKSAEEPTVKDNLVLPQANKDLGAAHFHLSNQGAQTSSKEVARTMARKILEMPEESNSRVDEIKALIAKGGFQAYFDTVDSEKLAERIVGSGVLDDMI